MQSVGGVLKDKHVVKSEAMHICDLSLSMDTKPWLFGCCLVNWRCKPHEAGGDIFLTIWIPSNQPVFHGNWWKIVRGAELGSFRFTRIKTPWEKITKCWIGYMELYKAGSLNKQKLLNMACKNGSFAGCKTPAFDPFVSPGRWHACSSTDDKDASRSRVLL